VAKSTELRITQDRESAVTVWVRAGTKVTRLKYIVALAGWTNITRARALDAARTAFAALLSLLAARALKLPEFYWAPISALVIVQSTAGTPLSVGWQRFVGTAIGAIAGAIAVTHFGPSALVFTIGIFLLGLICALLRVGTAYRFAGITLAIVLLIPHQSPAWVVAEHRFVEVSLGIAVALAVTTVWPLSKESKVSS
jgi:uncharacterized membrane protein YgaE (UPF0421/DUF939 family)